MPIEEAPQNTLRETLETNVEAAEAGTLQSPEEVARQPRDEAGRFAQKQKEEAEAAAKVVEVVPAPQRPSTWKKDYWGHYDKVGSGQALTPEEGKALQGYIHQRENEYKTGVSTYRAEAEKAKELQESIAPFLPELQANGINPSAWIRSMGQAHYALAKGTPDQKIAVFQELARRFGVPLGAVMQQGQPPQIVTELMNQQAAFGQQVNELRNWKAQREAQEQQQFMTLLSSEVQKLQQDTKTYPHFEAARETMAQLLERGLAADLSEAYDKAVWQVPEIRSQLIQAQVSTVTKPQAVAQAKAKAVSPKSSTPSGQIATVSPKDRRAHLEEQFEALGTGRL